MSIIHDALKKVQQNSNPAVPPPPASYQEPVPPPEPSGNKDHDKINIPLLVAAVCAVIAMLFAALPQFMPKKPLPPLTHTAARPQPPAVETAPSVPPEPAAPSTNTMSKALASAVVTPSVPVPKPTAPKVIDPNDPISSLQIEGIMDMGGKKVALINGNVYEEGQTIYGRIISEITFDSLTILENGRKRILPITVKP